MGWSISRVRLPLGPWTARPEYRKAHHVRVHKLTWMPYLLATLLRTPQHNIRHEKSYTFTVHIGNKKYLLDGGPRA